MNSKTEGIVQILAEHQQSSTAACGLEDECNCGHDLNGEPIALHQADMLAAWQAQIVREVSERVGKRYATLHLLRQTELQEQAWNEGAFSEHDFDGSPTGTNPYQRKGGDA